MEPVGTLRPNSAIPPGPATDTNVARAMGRSDGWASAFAAQGTHFIKTKPARYYLSLPFMTLETILR